jgi:hypothetical protein
MTWSYSGDPGASTRDEIRFLIQDTDTNDQLLSDEEIDYLISVWTDPYAAAVAAVTALIAQASRSLEESKKVGDLSLSLKSGARVQQWMMLKDQLQAERFRFSGGAPVYNANALVSTEDRSVEEETTDFYMGQFDNKT